MREHVFSPLVLCLLAAGTVVWAPPPDPDEVCEWGFRRVSSDRMYELKYEVEESRLEEVDMMETLRSEFPKACYVGGAEPCLGLAVINRKTNVVYLGHYAGQQPGQYDELIEQAVKEAATPEDLHVLIAGARIAETADSPNFEMMKRSAETYAADLRAKLAREGLKPEQIVDRLAVKPQAKSSDPWDTRNSYEILVDTKKKHIYLVAPKL